MNAAKILKILLAGLLISYAWPVRGQFGHEWGALIPGALAALIAAFPSSENWRRAFPQAVIFASLGFSVGGAFGYGALVNKIASAPSLQGVLPELAHVFLIGGIWGGVGMTALAFGLSEFPLKARDAAAVGAILAGAWIAHLFLPGPALLLGMAGGFTALHLYNAVRKSKIVLLFGTAGFAGFGAGSLLSVIILWFGAHGYLPGNWWSLRDQVWGFIGGLSVITAVVGALSKGWAPAPLSVPWQRAGFIALVTVIPGVNAWDVCHKWFDSTPPVSDTVLAGSILIATAALCFAGAFYFYRAPSAAFRSPLLEGTILNSSLFFIWIIGFLAIAKSIVYSGSSAWETAFSLIFVEALIFTLLLPAALSQK